LLDDRSGSHGRYELDAQMSLNGIQNLILSRSYDLMNLQAYVVLLLRNFWIQKVLNL
jgi:hypothetical protein